MPVDVLRSGLRLVPLAPATKGGSPRTQCTAVIFADPHILKVPRTLISLVLRIISPWVVAKVRDLLVRVFPPGYDAKKATDGGSDASGAGGASSAGAAAPRRRRRLSLGGKARSAPPISDPASALRQRFEQENRILYEYIAARRREWLAARDGAKGDASGGKDGNVTTATSSGPAASTTSAPAAEETKQENASVLAAAAAAAATAAGGMDTSQL